MGGIRNTRRFTLRSTSFLAFWLCGATGVLVDIDHPIAYYLLQEAGGRFLHAPLLFVGGIVLCCLGAYLGGLFIKLVLRRKSVTPSLGQASG